MQLNPMYHRFRYIFIHVDHFKERFQFDCFNLFQLSGREKEIRTGHQMVEKFMIAYTELICAQISRVFPMGST